MSATESVAVEGRAMAAAMKMPFYLAVRFLVEVAKFGMKKTTDRHSSSLMISDDQCRSVVRGGAR